ncbi:MAG: RIP metalloprotease RseP [Candidatus Colwellbacteria bacterium RIFCSPLOWO2_01_FULL_48_10]|uniref:Zinc metalloprotease n=1 Tax=Candidatus Colwellbacteria bacterium RIFCSPLOWO2_01_FULL_48_10 TaxID=1797690 RepID=A0A1G1Z3K6_9BACT|nr:MAG: RIP metalloprotease RseP [Candidatus Colwellbacteria bacterium RIFCSPLOWO2_01_FULL_48_10]
MLLTAFIFIAVLAILILGHELGHFVAAKIFRLRVDEFAFGFPPKIFSKKMGETTYTLNAIPFGGFVKIHGENGAEEAEDKDASRAFHLQSAWKRGLVMVAGVVMNFLIGWFAFSAIFMMGIPHKLYITQVFPGSPAAVAGFEPGDAIAGFETTGDFISFINANAGKTVSINGKELVPRINPPVNEGKMGIALTDAYVAPLGPIESFKQSFVKSFETLKSILAALGEIVKSAFTGGEALKEVAGPVGIFKIVGSASELGFVYLLQLLALLSLNLTIFNLLPIPALDGGRLLFVLIEKIAGRKLNAKYENFANLAGFCFLMLLVLAVTVSDIFKLTG